jgi:hypothetical protein
VSDFSDIQKAAGSSQSESEEAPTPVKKEEEDIYEQSDGDKVDQDPSSESLFD